MLKDTDETADLINQLNQEIENIQEETDDFQL